MYDAEVKKRSAVEVSDDGKKCFYFPYANYVTDVTFQNLNRHSGNIDKANVYYSGKHLFYGESDLFFRLSIVLELQSIALAQFNISTLCTGIIAPTRLQRRRCGAKRVLQMMGNGRKNILTTG